MTSSNINKIVRSNINLKPWILSKNTSEIVNTCIQKIYKQSQTNFRNDLLQTKIAAPKPENKGPIRSLKSQERIRPPISFVSRPKRDARSNTQSGGGGAVAPSGGERLVSAALHNDKKSAVANLAANRRLLRSSPNYKIYSSRRFGSSASSSNASIFRRKEDRRSNHNQTSQLNYLLRSFGTAHKASNHAPYGMNVDVARYALQARNQHMQSHAAVPPHAMQVSASIQRDLMAIDSTIKERIALGRKGLKLSARRGKDGDPMSGWNHPPPPELFMPRFKEVSGTNAELQEQYNRLKIVNRMRQFEQLQQMEKRANILGSISKRSNRGRPLDAFGQVKEQSPRTTPHQNARQLVVERTRRYMTRKAAAEQQQAEEEVAAMPPPPASYATLMPVEEITPDPTASAVASVVAATSNAALPGLPLSTTLAPASTTAAAAAAAATTLIPSRTAPLPSATSMLAAVTNRSTVYNNSRYNRSNYYRKF